MTTLPTNPTRPETGRTAVMRLSRIGKKYPFIQMHSPLKNEDFWALKNISCEMRQGQIYGVIGRNGAGKSTLLNIIAGVLTPTEGTLEHQGKIVGLLQLGIGFQDELTGEENIFLNAALLGASRRTVEERLEKIIEFSELDNFVRMPLGSYSQGMRLRLAFSILIHLDFDILILDEILTVGDALFQHKCFQRLMEFKRSGKTMLISSQHLELMERLCDQILLLDHGHLLFSGLPQEGIVRYQALLNDEKFFVGPGSTSLIRTTKKWAQDREDWGKSLGTKEAAISSVKFAKGRQSLRIKVDFSAKDPILEPHFGVALFRADGVYCYGPNTDFEQIMIPQINPGKGWFAIEFKDIVLAPGSYRVSVAIWDKKETLPYDYHNGFYPLEIQGRPHPKEALLNFRYQTKPGLFFGQPSHSAQMLAALNNQRNTPSGHGGGALQSLTMFTPLEKAADFSRRLSLTGFNAAMKTEESFMTNEDIIIKILKGGARCKKFQNLWLGLFRDDGIFCQEFIVPTFKHGEAIVQWPRCPLLPGGYELVAGLWDRRMQNLMDDHVLRHSFRMVFNRQDHGTVYVPHRWFWQLPPSRR